MSQSRFILYFALIALSGVLLATALVYARTRSIDNNTLLEIGNEQNALLGRTIDFQNTDGQQLTQLEIDGYTVVQNGTVTYSTDPSQLGQAFRENTDSQTAFRQGRAVSSLDDSTVTTYLPLFEGDEKIGLAVITREMSSTQELLADQRNDLTLLVVMSLLVLLTALSVFLAYLYNWFNEENATLHQQNSQLMIQLISRADFSHMSLLALQSAFRKLNPDSADSNTLRGYQEIEGLAGNLALVEKIERIQLSPEKKPFGLDELLRERASQFDDTEVVVGENSGLGLIADRAMIAHAVDALLTNLNYYNLRKRAIKLSSHPNGRITRITASLPIAENVDTLPPINPNQHIDMTVARLMVESHGGSLEFSYVDGIQFHINVPSG